jgi:hypothetical protein
MTTVRRRSPLPWLAALLLVLAPRAARADDAVEAARHAESEARLKKDITFLASDVCEGRGPTTAGINKAADYIANAFKEAGLKPGGSDGTYFQPFPLNGSVLEAAAALSLTGPQGQQIALQQGKQFWPMGLGGPGKAEGAGVVFAGYGQIYKDYKGQAYGQPLTIAEYDDYKGLDAKGKVVIVLNDTPRGIRPERSGRGGSYLQTMLAGKILNAEKAGAAALIFVHDLDTAKDGDDLYDFGYTALSRQATAMPKLPVLHVRRSVVDALLAPSGVDLAGLQRGIDRDLKPNSFELKGWKADVDVKMKRDKIYVKNVIGVLDGAGPLANEIVVVGAHYDHLGYGGSGGSLAAPKKMVIHHGADDNGSGTTTVLELARRFAAQKDRQGRKIAFMLFSGEELGLLGSKHYAKSPTLPIADTAAMLNLDMVGRVMIDPTTKRERLIAEGLGSAKEFEELVNNLTRKYDYQVRKEAGVGGYSDHASFYAVKVPALFFWNGTHPQYHRPTDTSDLINVPGMRRVADMSEECLAALATMPRPKWQEAPPVRRAPGVGGPRLGITPDYAAGGEGVAVQEVSKGGIAEKAGVKAGDRIVGLAGKPVADLAGYSEIMAAQREGDSIDVVVLREGQRLTLKAKLE